MSKSNKPYLSQNHFADWMQSPKKMLKRCQGKPEELTEEQQKLCKFGHRIHTMAQLLYRDGIEPIDERTIETYQTQSMALLKARIPLFEPQFEYDGLFARIDIMLPVDNDSWELIEVKSAKKIHEDWIRYTAFLYYVCINVGIKVSKCSIMHLKGYIHDDVSIEETFDKTDITGMVLELQKEIKANIKQMRETFKQEG